MAFRHPSGLADSERKSRSSLRSLRAIILRASGAWQLTTGALDLPRSALPVAAVYDRRRDRSWGPVSSTTPKERRNTARSEAQRTPGTLQNHKTPTGVTEGAHVRA